MERDGKDREPDEGDDSTSQDGNMQEPSSETKQGSPPSSFQDNVFLQTRETMTSRQGQSVTFCIAFHCLSENKRSEKTLVVRMPETVFGLKQRIQSQFNIPVHCQQLYFESIPLKDRETLHFYRLQDRDQLYVCYTSEGDVEDVLGSVSLMHGLIAHLEPARLELSDSLSPELDLKINTMVKSTCMKVDSLASEYFYPCSSDRADANRWLFIDNDGLDVMHRLHTTLLQIPWRNMPLRLQFLEHSILRILWNITAAFSIRSLVLHFPTIHAVSLSMLRVVIEPWKSIETPKNEQNWRSVSQKELDCIAAEVVYKAMGTMSNLAELPECRLQIASNERIVEQFIGAMLTPSYGYIASLVTAAGILCLTYSSETHQHLAKPHIIDGMMEACNMHRPWCQITDKERRLNRLLLTYFTTMFFAQLASTSIQLLTPEYISKIHDFISNFIKTADYTEVREQEVKNGYIWSTLVPVVKLVYQPSPHGSTNGDQILQELCIEAGIFSLQNVLSGEASRKVLIQEGLVEYVTCMLWYTPRVIQPRARQLVSMLGKKIQLQPPRLGVMTRVKLATLHFGFTRVLQAVSVCELLADVYQDTC